MSKGIKFDRDWGWKFESNLETHGLAFAVERAKRAGATPREVKVKLLRVRREQRRAAREQR